VESVTSHVKKEMSRQTWMSEPARFSSFSSSSSSSRSSKQVLHSLSSSVATHFEMVPTSPTAVKFRRRSMTRESEYHHQKSVETTNSRKVEGQWTTAPDYLAMVVNCSTAAAAWRRGYWRPTCSSFAPILAKRFPSFNFVTLWNVQTEAVIVLLPCCYHAAARGWGVTLGK
jgi:hypothetical protein